MQKAAWKLLAQALWVDGPYIAVEWWCTVCSELVFYFRRWGCFKILVGVDIVSAVNRQNELITHCKTWNYFQAFSRLVAFRFIGTTIIGKVNFRLNFSYFKYCIEKLLFATYLSHNVWNLKLSIRFCKLQIVTLFNLFSLTSLVSLGLDKQYKVIISLWYTDSHLVLVRSEQFFWKLDSS